MTTCKVCQELVPYIDFFEHTESCKGKEPVLVKDVTPPTSPMAAIDDVVSTMHLKEMFPGRSYQDIKDASKLGSMNEAIDYLTRGVDETPKSHVTVFETVKDALHAFRQKILDETLPEKKLEVNRKRIWNNIRTFYKNCEEIEMRKALVVNFTDDTGEGEAVDGGAIHASFFQDGFDLMTEKLLQVTVNHGFIPKRLGRNRVALNYTVLGKLMVHSAINDGPTLNIFQD